MAVASSIILVEARHQRQQAGLYDASRMDPLLYRDRLFRWCQPVVAEFCDARGLAYPALDDEGEIIAAPAWYKLVREGTAPLRPSVAAATTAADQGGSVRLEDFLTE